MEPTHSLLTPSAGSPAVFLAGNAPRYVVRWQDFSARNLLSLPGWPAAGATPAAAGAYSSASGYNTLASGGSSFATGFACLASGLYSVALGTENEVSGSLSAAVGGFNKVNGAGSFAAGIHNVASGEYAVAFGRGTAAASYAEFVVGSYNELATAASSSRPQTADRALVVGTGTGDAHRRDGFVVYKDGSLGLSALAQVPADTGSRLYALAGKLYFNNRALATVPDATEAKTTVQWQVQEATKTITLPTAPHRAANVEIPLPSVTNWVSARLLLHNKKAALRFGYFDEKEEICPIGQYSVSFGSNSTASGEGSFATGRDSTASGSFAVALGKAAQATGKYTFAAGASETKYSRAYGDSSVALAGGQAGGECAVALAEAKALGSYTLAAGYGSEAIGNFSVALGVLAQAYSYGETVVGACNTKYTAKDTKQYNELDRAFCVGTGFANGKSYRDQKKDGLVIFKNGRVLINNDQQADGAYSIVQGLHPAQLQVNAQDSDGLTIRTNSSHNTLNLIKAAGTNNPTFASFGYLSASDGASYREIGSIKADGENAIKFNTSSDVRLKNDSGLVTGSLNMLMQVKIHEFTWKSNGAADVGVFAQELHEVYPLAVQPGDAGPQVEKRWMVDYSKLQPLAVAAIQELHGLVSKQQQQLARLSQEVESLTAQVRELIVRQPS